MNIARYESLDGDDQSDESDHSRLIVRDRQTSRRGLPKVFKEIDDDDDQDDDGGRPTSPITTTPDSLKVGPGTGSSLLQPIRTVTVSGDHEKSAVRVVLTTKTNRQPLYKNFQYCALFVQAKKPHGLIVTLDKLKLRPGIDWLRLSINNESFVREFSHVTIHDERDSVAYVANNGVLIELR